MARPSALLTEIATPSAGVPYGHAIVLPTARSPKIQSKSESGLVPLMATAKVGSPRFFATYIAESSKPTKAEVKLAGLHTMSHSPCTVASRLRQSIIAARIRSRFTASGRAVRLKPR